MSIYTVRSGDSPFKIARKFGVRLDDLISANAHKDTTLVAGVRTWQSLQPGEVLSVPGGSELDVEATAVAALALLNADPNHCESVRHAGTPVNVAIHNFKRAWNASGQEILLPIGTGKYEAITARALSVVMGGAPQGRGASRNPDRFTETTGVSDAGIGDGTATGLPGNTITGGFGTVPEFPDAQGQFNASAVPTAIPPPPVVNMPPPPVVPPVATPAVPSASDTLAAVAAAAASALSADSNHCTSVGHPGSAVNMAVHAFKQAWNTANPDNKVPVGTGKYEPSVAAALATLLGTGVAPDGCGPTKHAPSLPPPPPPPAAVAVVSPPATPAPPHPAAPSNPAYVALQTAAAMTGVPLPPVVPAPHHRPAPPVFAASVAPPPPPATPDVLTTAASTAATALNADPNYCESVRHPGTPVNKSVHAFKHAWNVANPSSKLPIGTGKYEPSVAAALTSVVGAGMAPEGCHHRPAPPTFVPPPPPVFVSPSTPIAQVPAPPPVDTSATVPAPTPVADNSSAAPVVPPPPPSGGGKVQQAGLLPPSGDGEKKEGISMGALIAGSIGAVALVGIVAAAASGKGKTIIHHRKSAPAAPKTSERRGKSRRRS